MEQGGGGYFVHQTSRPVIEILRLLCVYGYGDILDKYTEQEDAAIHRMAVSLGAMYRASDDLWGSRSNRMLHGRNITEDRTCGNTESRNVEEATGNVAVDPGVVDQSVVDQSVVDQSVVDQSVMDQSVVDPGVVDQSVVDQGVVNQGVVHPESATDGSPKEATCGSFINGFTTTPFIANNSPVDDVKYIEGRVAPGQIIPGQAIPGQIIPGPIIPGRVLPGGILQAQVLQDQKGPILLGYRTLLGGAQSLLRGAKNGFGEVTGLPIGATATGGSAAPCNQSMISRIWHSKKKEWSSGTLLTSFFKARKARAEETKVLQQAVHKLSQSILASSSYVPSKAASIELYDNAYELYRLFLFDGSDDWLRLSLNIIPLFLSNINPLFDELHVADYLSRTTLKLRLGKAPQRGLMGYEMRESFFLEDEFAWEKGDTTETLAWFSTLVKSLAAHMVYEKYPDGADLEVILISIAILSTQKDTMLKTHAHNALLQLLPHIPKPMAMKFLVSDLNACFIQCFSHNLFTATSALSQKRSQCRCAPKLCLSCAKVLKLVVDDVCDYASLLTDVLDLFDEDVQVRMMSSVMAIVILPLWLRACARDVRIVLKATKSQGLEPRPRAASVSVLKEKSDGEGGAGLQDGRSEAAGWAEAGRVKLVDPMTSRILLDSFLARFESSFPELEIICVYLLTAPSAPLYLLSHTFGIPFMSLTVTGMAMSRHAAVRGQDCCCCRVGSDCIPSNWLNLRSSSCVSEGRLRKLLISLEQLALDALRSFLKDPNDEHPATWHRTHILTNPIRASKISSWTEGVLSKPREYTLESVTHALLLPVDIIRCLRATKAYMTDTYLSVMKLGKPVVHHSDSSLKHNQDHNPLHKNSEWMGALPDWKSQFGSQSTMGGEHSSADRIYLEMEMEDGQMYQKVYNVLGWHAHTVQEHSVTPTGTRMISYLREDIDENEWLWSLVSSLLYYDQLPGYLISLLFALLHVLTQPSSVTSIDLDPLSPAPLRRPSNPFGVSGPLEVVPSIPESPGNSQSAPGISQSARGAPTSDQKISQTGGVASEEHRSTPRGQSHMSFTRANLRLPVSQQMPKTREGSRRANYPLSKELQARLSQVSQHALDDLLHLCGQCGRLCTCDSLINLGALRKYDVQKVADSLFTKDPEAIKEASTLFHVIALCVELVVIASKIKKKKLLHLRDKINRFVNGQEPVCSFSGTANVSSPGRGKDQSEKKCAKNTRANTVHTTIESNPPASHSKDMYHNRLGMCETLSSNVAGISSGVESAENTVSGLVENVRGSSLKHAQTVSHEFDHSVSGHLRSLTPTRRSASDELYYPSRTNELPFGSNPGVRNPSSSGPDPGSSSSFLDSANNNTANNNTVNNNTVNTANNNTVNNNTANNNSVNHNAPISQISDRGAGDGGSGEGAGSAPVSGSKDKGELLEDFRLDDTEQGPGESQNHS
ncbi:hypothetical protein GNI_128960, partial [Gregarina niphandrodes]